MLGLAVAVWVVLRAAYVNWPAAEPNPAPGTQLLAGEDARVRTATKPAQEKNGADQQFIAPTAPVFRAMRWQVTRPALNNATSLTSAKATNPPQPLAATLLKEPDATPSDGSMDQSPALPPRADDRSNQPAGPSQPGPRNNRWSFDAWAYWRDGSESSAASGVVTPGYGRSQAGGILRYALAPQSTRKPEAFVRISSAFEQRDTDIATGVSAKPVPSLPVRAHVELRYTRFEDGSAWRPAAYATTGFDKVALPLGSTLRGYAAAGYVGGEASTPFVDGQLVTSRKLRSVGATEVSIGAGAWGGAQDGAERLDVGPSAGLAFPIASGTARLSLDYRQRIAGNAAPSSGIAATLATSF